MANAQLLTTPVLIGKAGVSPIESKMADSKVASAPESEPVAEAAVPEREPEPQPEPVAAPEPEPEPVVATASEPEAAAAADGGGEPSVADLLITKTMLTPQAFLAKAGVNPADSLLLTPSALVAKAGIRPLD